MSPLLVILLILVALPVLGAVYQFIQDKRDRLRYPPPGELVDVGGHRLHALVMGREQGAPTIVFEAGVGNSGIDWEYVQKGLGDEVCSVTYDRAGYGWSKPSTQPRTPERIAEELHRLLEALNVPKPYVFVAHSFGGLYARKYIQQYPNEVAGLVLVDSSHPGMLNDRDIDGETARLRRVRLFKRIGLMRLILPRIMTHYNIAPKAERARFLALNLRNTEPVLDEATPLFERGIDLPDTLGDLPLVVISRAIDEDLKSERRWGDFQRDLVNLSPNAEFLTTEETNHYIPVTEPEFVVQAIHKLLQALRNDTATKDVQ
ncbi:MAG: alpha/beta hydrolase [Chloroflexi bacterium]|nr:MAG: alpha/beta hydrolase [Chloroflexota bacterium]